MREIQIDGRVVRFDREQTQSAYASIICGGADECKCSYCRNFAAQRLIAYPQEFRSLLDQLGIDPEKEGEVFDLGSEGSRRLYGGWLFFSGESDPEQEDRSIQAGPDFDYRITRAADRPRPWVDFGDQVLVLDFLTKLPWVLEEEP